LPPNIPGHAPRAAATKERLPPSAAPRRASTRHAGNSRDTPARRSSRSSVRCSGKMRRLIAAQPLNPATTAESKKIRRALFVITHRQQ
jgi:hypothetical protein